MIQTDEMATTGERPSRPGTQPLRYRVGARLRQSRKRQGLTLLDVAKRCRTTQQTIQRLETGNMSIDMEWLELITGVLDISIAEIFNETLAQSHFQRAEFHASLAAFDIHIQQLAAHTAEILAKAKQP